MNMMRRMRRFGVERTGEGPVYLGYRIGHIRNDSRAFRAIVYNKAAVVLHQLRRLVGDEAFFRGMRRFYEDWRFRKAGTEDFRRAMEAEVGAPLDRFFERWVHSDALPQLAFTYRLEEGEGGRSDAVLRFEQTGDVFDVPVTVTVEYLDRPAADVLVKVTDQVVEHRVALTGKLRSITANKDELALVEIR
jgi:aminopeptidase N